MRMMSAQVQACVGPAGQHSAPSPAPRALHPICALDAGVVRGRAGREGGVAGNPGLPVVELQLVPAGLDVPLVGGLHPGQGCGVAHVLRRRGGPARHRGECVASAGAAWARLRSGEPRAGKWEGAASTDFRQRVPAHTLQLGVRPAHQAGAHRREERWVVEHVVKGGDRILHRRPPACSRAQQDADGRKAIKASKLQASPSHALARATRTLLPARAAILTKLIHRPADVVGPLNGGRKRQEAAEHGKRLWSARFPRPAQAHRPSCVQRRLATLWPGLPAPAPDAQPTATQSM